MQEQIRLVVWGTGGLAANTLSYNAAWLKAVDIVCFVSNSHPVGKEEMFSGRPVIAPEELYSFQWDYLAIFSTYINEIKEQIVTNLKIPDSKILSLEELAQRVVEHNEVSIINRDVVLYGENYNTDNYLYHIKKRVKSLKIISNGMTEINSDVEEIDISEIKNIEFDYLLLLSYDEKTEDKLLNEIFANNFHDMGKILKISQWACDLALEYKIVKNESDIVYYAIVGRPTWGLMALFTEFMRAAAFAYERGYIPFIDMQNSANMYLENKDFGVQNAWEYYFTQPKDISDKSIEDIYKTENVVISSKFFKAEKNRDVVNSKEALENLKRIYHNQFRIQDSAMKEIIPEYKRIFEGIEGKRILGAIYRGTDYINIKPARHFIQPDLEEFISICKEYMQNWECEYLFVATEDSVALESLKKVFGNRLLFTNQLRYSETGDKFLFQIANKRDNDKYLRGVEYLTALYCLTKCDCLISGRNGGLNGVLILKEDKYERIYIINKGKYSNENVSFN